MHIIELLMNIYELPSINIVQFILSPPPQWRHVDKLLIFS